MCVCVCVPKCLCVLYVVFFWSLYIWLFTHNRKGWVLPLSISAFFRNDCCYNRRFVVGLLHCSHMHLNCTAHFRKVFSLPSAHHLWATIIYTQTTPETIQKPLESKRLKVRRVSNVLRHRRVRLIPT